jgi:hypothetical protein
MARLNWKIGMLGVPSLAQPRENSMINPSLGNWRSRASDSHCNSSLGTSSFLNMRTIPATSPASSNSAK